MDVKSLALALGVSMALMGVNTAVALQGATPVGPPLPEGCTVVAEGLINPRYVAVADDGSIYVSEAGTGGDEVIEMQAPAVDATPADFDATPPAEEGMGHAASSRGDTGQVTVISPDGTQSVLASGLPSYRLGGPEVTGPAGIAVADDGKVLLAIGGAGPLTAATEPLPNENSVVSIDPASGEVTLLADIGSYERANNPDPHAIDSNIYGIGVAADGTIYVNDAGGNATYLVPAGGGDPELLAAHPGIPLPEGVEAPPGGNPGRGGALELDPVPTDVEVLEDGTVLSGLLSGGPFPPGAAKVVSVGADGTLTDVATGLTMVVGLAVGPDGHLYVSQISTNFLGEVPTPGSVVRVFEDGTQEVVLDGLMLPNGIAFEADGSMLVITGATSPAEPMGQLLRCTGVSTAEVSEEMVVVLDDAFFRSR